MNQQPQTLDGSDDLLEGYLPPEDSSEGFVAIPEGVYPITLEELHGQTTRAGGFGWNTTWVVNSGEHAGKKLFFFANWTDAEGNMSGGIGFTQMMLKALGVQYVSTTGSIQPVQMRKSDLIGRQAQAVVSIQREGQYKGNNSVDRIEALEGVAVQPVGVAPAPAGAPPAAPVPQPVAPAAPVVVPDAAPAVPVAAPPPPAVPVAPVPVQPQQAAPVAPQPQPVAVPGGVPPPATPAGATGW